MIARWSARDVSWRLTLLALAAAVVLPSNVRAQDPQPDARPGIAVFPFFNGSFGPGSSDMEPFAVGLQQMLLTELSLNPALRIVDRSILNELMAEQELGASGRVDANTAARLGRIVGARYAVTGSFVADGERIRMDARIDNAETTEVVKAERLTGSLDDVYEMVVDLAERVMSDVELPPLEAAVREERREREIPKEAVTLYSRALVLQDRGLTDRAAELFQQIVDRFPQMREAREALVQLRSG